MSTLEANKFKEESQVEHIVNLYNALAAVGTYINAIDVYEFDVPSPAPEWFWDFESNIAQLKSDVERWNKVIAKYLQGVPKVIYAMDGIIDRDFGGMQDLLDELIKDPENFERRRQLRDTMNRVLGEFGEIDAEVHTLMDELDGFSEKIRKAIDVFTHFTVEVINSEQEAREKIENLQAKVTELNDLIKKHEQRITRDEIIAGAGIIIVGIGLWMWWPPATPIGALVALCGIVIYDIAAIDAILAMEEVQQLQQELFDAAQEIEEENRMVASLGALSASFGPLIDKAQKAEDAMQVFQDIWSGIDGKLHDILSKIEEISPDELEEAKKLLQGISDTWEEVVDLAKFLKSIDYTVKKQVVWLKKPQG